MKQKLPGTSKAEGTQKNVRSITFRDSFSQSADPYLPLRFERVILIRDEGSSSTAEPQGFQPQTQSMSPHLNGPHQRPTPDRGGSISGSSDVPRSLKKNCTSPRDERGLSLFSKRPAITQAEVPCMAPPHSRVLLGGLVSNSYGRRGSVSSSPEAPVPPAPFSVCQTRKPVVVSGFCTDSSVPRQSQKFGHTLERGPITKTGETVPCRDGHVFRRTARMSCRFSPVNIAEGMSREENTPRTRPGAGHGGTCIPNSGASQRIALHPQVAETSNPAAPTPMAPKVGQSQPNLDFSVENGQAEQPYTEEVDIVNFKLALARFAKPKLRPFWLKQHLNNETYIKILDKFVENVSRSLRDGAPQTREKSCKFIEKHKCSLSKFLQMYLQRFVSEEVIKTMRDEEKIDKPIVFP